MHRPCFCSHTQLEMPTSLHMCLVLGCSSEWAEAEAEAAAAAAAAAAAEAEAVAYSPHFVLGELSSGRWRTRSAEHPHRQGEQDTGAGVAWTASIVFLAWGGRGLGAGVARTCPGPPAPPPTGSRTSAGVRGEAAGGGGGGRARTDSDTDTDTDADADADTDTDTVTDADADGTRDAGRGSRMAGRRLQRPAVPVPRAEQRGGRGSGGISGIPV
eukprot:gene23974-biopygen7360